MINQQLIDFISQLKSQGVSREDIVKRLSESGWEDADIIQAYGDDKVKPQNVIEDVVKAKKSKKKSTKKIIFTSLIIISVAGIGYLITKDMGKKTEMINPSQELKTNVKENPAVYLSNINGFQIKAPEGWKTEESGTDNVLVNFINPAIDEDKGSKFATNINVTMEITNIAKLSDYVSKNAAVSESTLENYVKLSEREIEINGNQGLVIEGKYDIGVYQLHNLQLFVLKYPKAYVVTATTFDTKWDFYKDVFNQTFLSFEVK